jgi:membrane protein implicated in regulation of membrane protease activity
MSIISKISAVVFLASGLLLLWGSFIAIFTPGGGTSIAAVASACFLVVLIIIMADIAYKLQNIYELLHQRDEKDKKKLRPIRDFDSDEMVLDAKNSSKGTESEFGQKPTPGKRL